MNKNISSANSTAVLIVDELFPAGVTLEQYSTDQALAQSEETIAETRMGVDGRMVAGYVPAIKTVTVNLEASSPSIDLFDMVYKASQTNKTCYKMTLIVHLPSVGKTITYSGGVLKTAKRMPDIKKVLEPMQYTIDFEKVS